MSFTLFLLLIIGLQLVFGFFQSRLDRMLLILKLPKLFFQGAFFGDRIVSFLKHHLHKVLAMDSRGRGARHTLHARKILLNGFQKHLKSLLALQFALSQLFVVIVLDGRIDKIGI